MTRKAIVLNEEILALNGAILVLNEEILALNGGIKYGLI
jgi:hypothetical protein